MIKLKEYTEAGFELQEPTYIFNDIYFIQTCGACPEQYSCYIIDSTGTKLEVAYVRIRWGRLACYFPGVHGECIFETHWGDGYKGCFDDQEERELSLNMIADAVETKLIEERVRSIRSPLFKYIDQQVAKDMEGFYTAFGLEPPNRKD